ncbi:MAG: hypothetical protein JWP35_457 [Caulobacter sp.]|nr:hypothetical protein [Caulobacter sp.]
MRSDEGANAFRIWRNPLLSNNLLPRIVRLAHALGGNMIDFMALAWMVGLLTVPAAVVLVVWRVTDRKSNFDVSGFGFKMKTTHIEPGDDLQILQPVPAPQADAPELGTQEIMLLPAPESTPGTTYEYAFVFSKSIDDLEFDFSAFRLTDTYAKDIEYWEIYYEKRRGELGQIDVDERLQDVALRNPHWVLPLVSLSERAIAATNLKAASDYSPYSSRHSYI